MLTKQQIQAKALECVAGGEAPLWGGGFVEGATWANEQNAQEIAELKFRVEGDAILLQAANQTIEKERAKIEILQGAYNTAKSHAAKLVEENTELVQALRRVLAKSPAGGQYQFWTAERQAIAELLKKYESDGK